MRAAGWSSVAVVVLLLAGCGGQTQVVQAHGSTLYLTENDNNKEFAVKRHSTIVLTLPSNRSTGFHWQWTYERSPIGAGLREISHRYIAPATSTPDADGKEVWRLRPAGNKGFMVQGLFFGRLLAHARPRRWAIARRFDFNIDVS